MTEAAHRSSTTAAEVAEVEAHLWLHLILSRMLELA